MWLWSVCLCGWGGEVGSRQWRTHKSKWANQSGSSRPAEMSASVSTRLGSRSEPKVSGSQKQSDWNTDNRPADWGPFSFHSFIVRWIPPQIDVNRQTHYWFWSCEQSDQLVKGCMSEDILLCMSSAQNNKNVQKSCLQWVDENKDKQEKCFLWL